MDAREIADRFELGAGATLSDGPVAHGKQGSVWRLDTADGRWAVKVPFYPSDSLEDAAAFQEAAHARGIPVPRIRRTGGGDLLATLGNGQRVRIYEWVDLLGCDPGLDPAQVGEVVAAIHQVPVDAALGPVDPWYCRPVGAEGWDRLVRRLREAGAPFAGRLGELRDGLVELETWIEPPETVRMCHRDLWADNFLAVAGGGVCVIDWENSGPADPAHELACVLYEFCRTDPGRARAFITAYLGAGGPARLSRRGQFTMLIAQLGHIAEIAATDWLEPESRSRDRDESAAWIGELLDDPHDRRGLELLLDSLP